MLLLSTKVPECNVEAIEWNWSGILLTPDLADTKEWPDPLCRMEEGFSIGSSAHDRNSSWATDDPPGTRLEDEDSTLGQQRRQPKAILSILVVHWMVALEEVVEEFHLLAVHDRTLRGFDFFGQAFSSSISLAEFLDTVLLCYLPQSQIEESHDQVYLLEDIVQG